MPCFSEILDFLTLCQTIGVSVFYFLKSSFWSYFVKNFCKYIGEQIKIIIDFTVSSKRSPKRCNRLDLNSDTALGFFRKEVSLKETGRGGFVSVFILHVRETGK